MTEKSVSLIISTKIDLNYLRFDKFILIGKITTNLQLKLSEFNILHVMKAVI